MKPKYLRLPRIGTASRPEELNPVLPWYKEIFVGCRRIFDFETYYVGNHVGGQYRISCRADELPEAAGLSTWFNRNKWIITTIITILGLLGITLL